MVAVSEEETKKRVALYELLPAIYRVQEKQDHLKQLLEIVEKQVSQLQEDIESLYISCSQMAKERDVEKGRFEFASSTGKTRD